jgi:hypothetical protein
MATSVSTLGKYYLLFSGWTTRIVRAKLYTSSNVLVATETVTFSYNSTTNILSPTAPIVFDVAEAVDDVAYVVIEGFNDPTYYAIYTKDLPSLYDFTTAGTLTVSSWEITFSGSYLLDAGKDILVTEGLSSKITWAKLYNASNVLLDTQSVTMSASSSTGIMQPTADIVFDVATGGVASYIRLGYTDGSDVICYQRTLPSTYTFTTAGTLTVDSWFITILSPGYATSWSYIGTSGTPNSTVNNVAPASTCNSSTTIQSFLNSEYPATNYIIGYVMRVFRTNENEVTCSPVYYFYQAIA